MKIASVLSTGPETEAAVEEAAGRLTDALDGHPPDLAVAYVSHHHAAAFDRLPDLLRPALGQAALVGTSGSGVIANGREVTRGPALVLWAAHLPGARVATHHLVCSQHGEDFVYDGWPERAADAAVAILHVDPFTNLPDRLFDGLADRLGPVPLVGGIASGGDLPRTTALFQDDRVHRHGTVAVVVHGEIGIETIVSQGCRPIGRHYVVTRAQENVIFEIGGTPALERFRAIYDELDEGDQELARRDLHVGRVLDEYKESFGRGDFLIRSCMGFDPQSGGVLVTDQVRRGQTIQFHVRDAASASEDLHHLLRARASEAPGFAGGLLFSCTGRGPHLFEAPDHDAAAVQEELGPIPLAGFFCGGEIGTIGGRTQLHGFTASLALFRPASPA